MLNFLTPLWVFLGAIGIPIILLYLLRQKRPEHAISSTLLWSQVLADMRASTPFQKLRRNLLLLLQLLILAALVFSRMRPVIHAKATRGAAGVIVIDATASMQATDHGGPSRLERAKQQAGKLVDDMAIGDQYMLLVDGGGITQKRTAFMNSKSDIHRLIDAVQASDTTSDLSETLLLAVTSLRAIGADPAMKDQPLKAGRIFLFSDGCGVHLPGVPGIADLLTYIKIGDSSSNAGIVRLAIDPVKNAPKTYQIFAGLVNNSSENREVAVGLSYLQPENIIDAKRVAIPAHGQASVIFQQTRDPGPVFLRMECPDDDLALDNTAWGILEPARKIRVILVSKGNPVLERFLSTEQANPNANISASLIDPARYKPDLAADLILFDGFTPAQPPRCDALFIHPNHDIGGFKLLGALDHPAVFRWKRDEPIMSFVELGELRISSALNVERNPSANELVSASTGPLLAAIDQGSSRDYILGFDPLAESNWWMQPSLLIFLQNLIDQTRSRHFIGTPQMIAAGQPAQLWDIEPGTTITLPDGSTADVNAKDGASEFPFTDHVGLYTVHSGGKTALFAVNLLAPEASDIAPRPLELPDHGNIDSAPSIATVNREIWPWIAAAGLLFLILEWWVYHYRVA